jgi:hypothetical protein
LCLLILHRTVIPGGDGKAEIHLLITDNNTTYSSGNSLIIYPDLLRSDGGREEARYQEDIEVLGFHM